jgi:tetratricopeptide (TPR) repeat protein
VPSRHRGRVALFVLVSAWASLLPARPPAQDSAFWSDPRQLLLLGIERLAQGDFREALPLFEGSLRLGPDNVLGHAWLAHALHLRRRLDEAASHYRRLLELDQPRPLDERRRAAMLRFSPRLFQVRSDPFRLLDAVAIHHPDEPLIAYHFFWEDDIDFPADNDPCDHELVWVRYDPASNALSEFYTYFHGRILSTAEAVRDAVAHNGRPRVNVQWGKHGSLPTGWETLEIQANADDSEQRYLDLQRPGNLKNYNFAAFQKLHSEGRQHPTHPRTSGWPVRFEGSWDDFIRFDRQVDLAAHLSAPNRLAVSRWNNAALQQNSLAYNFRPKTEWPDWKDRPAALDAQVERRVGASPEFLLRADEGSALRRKAGIVPISPQASRIAPALPFDLPGKSLFRTETPRFPNLWFQTPAQNFPTYRDFVAFLEQRFRSAGYHAAEVTLNEGADLALSVEHLDPWDSVEGLRHAHAVHIRFFWTRLEAESAQRVRVSAGSEASLYWRVAASVHYEVEHAHPLHADVELCPYCGRTGEYADAKGNLVEQVHDPLGLELTLFGRIRGEDVTTTQGPRLSGLKDFLGLKDADVHLSRPYREDMNTGAVAVVTVRSKT